MWRRQPLLPWFIKHNQLVRLAGVGNNNDDNNKVIRSNLRSIPSFKNHPPSTLVMLQQQAWACCSIFLIRIPRLSGWWLGNFSLFLFFFTFFLTREEMVSGDLSFKKSRIQATRTINFIQVLPYQLFTMIYLQMRQDSKWSVWPINDRT